MIFSSFFIFEHSDYCTYSSSPFRSFQLTEISQENSMLKGKILTLNETVNSTELETKASRETIMRLVSEVGKEQRDFERMQQEMDAFRSVCRAVEQM